MGLILENSSDTFWGGMLQEASGQNKAVAEVMRLEFRHDAGRGTPLAMGHWASDVCLH